MAVLRTTFVACLALCALVPVGALAQISDTIRPFVDLRYVDDDNIFRSTTNPESDTYLELGAGVDINLPVSRQNFGFAGKYTHVAYDVNDSLDHDDIDGNFTWDWVVGNRLNGDLRANYSETIGSFDEQATRTKDDRKDTNLAGTLIFELTPRWELVGAFDAQQSRVDNRPEVEFDATTAIGEVRYATGARTKIGARYTVTEGDYLNTQIVNGEPFDNDYTFTAMSGTFQWETTGKSKLNFELGYSEVDAAQGSEFDYDGRLMRAAYTWDATGKTRLLVRAWNQARGREEISGYVVTQGISIKPTLSMTSKLSGSLDLLYEDVIYEGDAAVAPTGAAREDTNKSVAASLSYALTRRIVGTLGYKTYDRASNVPGDVWTYSRWIAQLRASF